MEQRLVPSPAPNYITHPQKTLSLGHTHGLNLEVWYLGEPQK